MSERMNISPKGNIFPIDARGGGTDFYLFCFVIDVFSPIPFSSPKNYPPSHYFFATIENKKNTTIRFTAVDSVFLTIVNLVGIVGEYFVVLSTVMRISVVFWWLDILLLSTSKLRLRRSHFWLQFSIIIIITIIIISKEICSQYSSKKFSTHFYVIFKLDVSWFRASWYKSHRKNQQDATV